jgi:hypothetical protein
MQRAFTGATAAVGLLWRRADNFTDERVIAGISINAQIGQSSVLKINFDSGYWRHLSDSSGGNKDGGKGLLSLASVTEIIQRNFGISPSWRQARN